MPDLILQSTPDHGGSKAYSGVGRIGKTTLAVHHLNEDSKVTGYPKCPLDLGAVGSFRHLPHAQSVDEVLHDLFIKRVDSKPWTPPNGIEGRPQREKLWRALHLWGGVHCLCDEIWNMCNSDTVDPGLVTVSNQYGHGPLGPVYLYFIGQRVMFINQNLFASIREWYIFQSSEGTEQKTLRNMFGERVNGNEAWPKGKFEKFSRDARASAGSEARKADPPGNVRDQRSDPPADSPVNRDKAGVDSPGQDPGPVAPDKPSA